MSCELCCSLSSTVIIYRHDNLLLLRESDKQSELIADLPEDVDETLVQDDIPLSGHSMYLFSTSNPLRIAAFNLVQTRAFKFTIFAIIILSCIELTTEGPRVVPGSVEDTVLYYRYE